MYVYTRGSLASQTQPSLQVSLLHVASRPRCHFRDLLGPWISNLLCLGGWAVDPKHEGRHDLYHTGYDSGSKTDAMIYRNTSSTRNSVYIYIYIQVVVVHSHAVIVIIRVMINLKHHYHILYTRMAHSRSVLVGGCEVNIRNINQYSYLPNMGNYVKNNTDPTIINHICIYKLPVSKRICIIFPQKLRNKKQHQKAESYRVKSAASDLDRLSELLQIAANLLKLRGRDSCNHLVVLLRDLHMFLGNADVIKTVTHAYA